MAASPATTAEPVATPVPERRRRLPGARLLGHIRQAEGAPKRLLYIGTVIVVVFLILAIFAPLIAPYGFDQVEAHGVRFAKQAAPTWSHPFGTTVQSTDVLSRVIWGARTAVEVVVLSLVFSITIGVPLGLVSGYVGGRLDRGLVLINDALFAFPYLLLAIVIAFLLSDKIGQGIFTAAIAITVVYVPQYFRVVRNHVISIREESYVEAARALGAPRRTIIRRYVFSNVIQNVPALATLNAADAILTLAALGFLGYGIQPTQAAEWGYDINRAIDDAGAGIWWTGLFPGLAIVLLVTGFTLVGEGLNDVLNPLIRKRRIRRPRIPTGAEPGGEGSTG
jgi:peptide/nickel transport system permease protein